MAIENADLEGDLYYVGDDGLSVFKRPVQSFREDGTSAGSTMGFKVCTTDEWVDGAAVEIARSLNRLPKAEALMIKVAGSIREGAEPQPLADEIEQWIVDGADA